MRRKHLLIAASIVSASITLPGCVAVPIAAMVNAAHKSGTSTIVVTGPDKQFPGAFRSAVQRSGGMAVQTTTDYGLATFARESVRVEYQRTGAGTYQLVGASDGGVSRAYDFSDSVTTKAQAVAAALTAAGYTVTAADRQRGL